jgi:hypothetical protein
MLHVFIDSLRNAILITGLVIIMMMMIESLNIESKGLFFKGLKKTRIGQVIFGALLGSIPGCMGGFATVSLYTHRMFSFGSLVAMMIASSGDEVFIMLAMIPDQALILFAVLFVLAIIVGIGTDLIHDKIHKHRCSEHDHSKCGADTDCHDGYVVHQASPTCHHHDSEVSSCHPEHSLGHHEHTSCHPEHTSCHPERSEGSRHYGWKRISMFIGLAIFIAALATGQLGHDHSAHSGHNNETHQCDHTACHPEHITCHPEHNTCHPEGSEGSHSINLLDEEWMNVLFAGLSVIVLFVLLFASDHFIEEHLWNHILRKHLLTIFCLTFGVLLIVGTGLQYVNIDHWISNNTALMIVLATLIGIIPESGPHMIFVTLYATGIVPFPVLLASSISQDGHASLPLIAESRRSFLWAKVINCAVALAAGFISMAFI